MRIDLLKRWLKLYPYGYCDRMNFQTCRATDNNECPYCIAGVHCSEGNSVISYYREQLRFKRMKPRRARKIAIAFAEVLPSIMRSLDDEIATRCAERERQGAPHD